MNPTLTPEPAQKQENAVLSTSYQKPQLNRQGSWQNVTQIGSFDIRP